MSSSDMRKIMESMETQSFPDKIVLSGHEFTLLRKDPGFVAPIKHDPAHGSDAGNPNPDYDTYEISAHPYYRGAINITLMYDGGAILGSNWQRGFAEGNENNKFAFFVYNIHGEDGDAFEQMMIDWLDKKYGEDNWDIESEETQREFDNAILLPMMPEFEAMFPGWATVMVDS